MDDLNSTVDWTFNNTFYTPNGRIAVHCNKATSWTLAQYQQMGYDLKSTEAVSPPLETLIEWSRELIDAIKSSQRLVTMQVAVEL